MTETKVKTPVQPPLRLRLMRLEPLLGFGLAFGRYHAAGAVWLLALELEPLLGVSTWRLCKLQPELGGREFTRRLRLADGPQHPHRVFSLPAVRSMALMRSGAAVQALFNLVDAEICAGRQHYPERPAP